MHRRLSIRVRVTLIAALLAIVTGALGVTITLAITRNGLRSAARSAPLAPATRPGAQPGLGGLLPGDPGFEGPVADPLGAGTIAGGVVQPGDPLATPQGRAAEGDRVTKVIDESRGRGLLTVLGLAGIALVAAWFAAGGMLRPIRSMTSTARQVASPGSGRRMRLDGPSDELHDLADTIDEMLDRLDASFDAQRRFVADASHELRTPLAVLMTEVDVALDDPGAPTSELRASLGRVHDELTRTSRLVESLLHLSRAETLATKVEHDLATSAEQAVAVVRRLGLRPVEIETALATAPVHGDPVLLDRMVANLVENAVRYNVDDGRVHVSTSSAGGLSVLVVENDGPRLDPATVERLFERFRRGAHGAVTRTRQDGHGLGLSIAQTVVATHGGTIELQARRGGGLRVHVTLG